jgi:AcrR family transcriptional regulator
MSDSAPAHRPPQRQPIPAETAQKRLLDAADALFYREGVRNVGVDSVVAEAGVNKMSLYRQFASKDALMLAYLERQERRYWRKFDASVAKHADAPARQLPQFFADWAERAAVDDYRGCPFVNVACEFADPAHPARRFVFRHKAELLARIEAIVRAAGARHPAELAGAIALLVEGCYTASQTYGNRHPMLKSAAACVEAMIAAACAPEPGRTA